MEEPEDSRINWVYISFSNSILSVHLTEFLLDLYNLYGKWDNICYLLCFVNVVLVLFKIVSIFLNISLSL